eukprot:scaffold213018_cov39-Prasinocladus_malaysianus.AAC.1
MPQDRQHVGPWGLATPQISCSVGRIYRKRHRVYGMQLAISAPAGAWGLDLRILHAGANRGRLYVPSRVADMPARTQG